MAGDDKSIVVRDLEKRFGRFVAVNRISFDVAKGEVFGFLGPNGAGKSTTIRMLCGILAPSGGTGVVAGFDIRTDAERIKSSIGYMSQKFSLYEDLTVEENINFYSGIYRIPAARKKERKAQVIEMAGLGEMRSTRVSVLSGGWKQRLALGCAILHEPPILFLDEPTCGVDPISRRRFWELIYELASPRDGRPGATVFVTTHYIVEAEYCNRVGFIYRGEVIALGSPRTLKAELMRDQVIEIVCDRPEDALEQVRELDGVKDVALFGKGLHVMVADAERASPAVGRLLGEKGFNVERVERIEPSLEDVFVSLIEERDRAGEPQREVLR